MGGDDLFTIGVVVMVEPGRVVDRYRLDEVLLRGSSSTVFAATDLNLGRRVAFKVLDERYAADPAIRQRFVEAAQVAASLDAHPHIATVLKVGQFEDSVYLVTELVTGVSLAAVLAGRPSRPLEVAPALRLLHQVADALDFAHRHNAVHGDVNPTNVLVVTPDAAHTTGAAEPTVSAYLINFGMTELRDASDPLSGDLAGALDYAAPERLSGAAIDPRADVYSLACIAFQMITGQLPFGDATTDADRITAHLQRPVPNATALRPGLPAGIDALFAKALAKSREQRFQTSRAFIRDLAGLFPELTARRPLTPGAPLPPLHSSGQRRRWPYVAAVVVVGAVGISAIATFLAAANRKEPVAAVQIVTTTRPSTTTSSTNATTTTTTTTTSTSIPRTTVAPTTTAVGQFGIVGARVVEASGPETAYALAVQGRADPSRAAAPGSPAWYYVQWLRAAHPSPADGGVVGTAAGLVVTADSRVELRDFKMADGLVTSFTECRSGECVPLETATVLKNCEPGPDCGHLRSTKLWAYERAILTVRWPVQVLILELVPDEGTAAITEVDEPNRNISYDESTAHLVLTFPDRPASGTVDQLTVRFADGSTDTITITYG